MGVKKNGYNLVKLYRVDCIKAGEGLISGQVPIRVQEQRVGLRQLQNAANGLHWIHQMRPLREDQHLELPHLVQRAMQLTGWVHQILNGDQQ